MNFHSYKNLGKYTKQEIYFRLKTKSGKTALSTLPRTLKKIIKILRKGEREEMPRKTNTVFRSKVH